ncbi:MAG: hypothetical protein LBC86_07750 [Oscillospiraceae bacterium]|jgi:C4-type Zn-finger protein|nr:hypothetical protein [Oscillospiraceae bacterium]
MMTQTENIKTRVIKCPVCHKGRIADTLMNIPYMSISACALPYSQSVILIVKCRCCGNSVGISYTQ